MKSDGDDDYPSKNVPFSFDEKWFIQIDKQCACGVEDEACAIQIVTFFLCILSNAMTHAWKELLHACASHMGVQIL